jgi:hypothetical protein
MTKYKVENIIKPSYSYKNKFIEEIKKKYNQRKSKDENSKKMCSLKKTYQVFNNKHYLDESKNNYENKDFKEKILFKETIPHKYTSGLYRNNSYYNLKKPPESNIKKHYYNYGPIYSYERSKELKIQNISPIKSKKEKENEKENGKEENEVSIYKISNPYKEQKTYCMQTKNIYSKPTNNNTQIDLMTLNKSNLNREHSDIYYNKNEENKENNDYINVDNNNISINGVKNLKKNMSVERPNLSRNKTNHIKKLFFAESENLNSSLNNISNNTYINNNNNNNSLINRRNYSTLDVRNNNNDINYNNNIYYRNSYSNSFLLNNYKKHQKVSYTDKLSQYSAPVIKTNDFSENSFFKKLNYVYN